MRLRYSPADICWFVERAPAERDDAPLHVDDREHESMAEAIVVAGAALSRCDEADLLGRCETRARIAQVRRQTVPTVRRVADAKGLQSVGDRVGG